MCPVNDLPKFKKNEKLESQDIENQMQKMMSAELIKKIQARINSGDENFMKTLRIIMDDDDTKEILKPQKKR